jgi:hypothetical protein
MDVAADVLFHRCHQLLAGGRHEAALIVIELRVLGGKIPESFSVLSGGIAQKSYNASDTGVLLGDLAVGMAKQ